MIEPDHEDAFADRLGQRYDTALRSFGPAEARPLPEILGSIKRAVDKLVCWVSPAQT